jgi:hypothetical protein
MKPKVGLICLGVRDLQRSLTFYRDGLGLPPHNYTDGDDCIFFAMEGAVLSLYPRDKLAEDVGVAEVGSGFAGLTLAHNEPSKEGVDRVFAEALAAGATAVKAPRDVFWGGYSGYFADPDGHLWEIAWNPFTDLT